MFCNSKQASKTASTQYIPSLSPKHAFLQVLPQPPNPGQPSWTLFLPLRSQVQPTSKSACFPRPPITFLDRSPQSLRILLLPQSHSICIQHCCEETEDPLTNPPAPTLFLLFVLHTAQCFCSKPFSGHTCQKTHELPCSQSPCYLPSFIHQLVCSLPTLPWPQRPLQYSTQMFLPRGLRTSCCLRQKRSKVFVWSLPESHQDFTRILWSARLVLITLTAMARIV